MDSSNASALVGANFNLLHGGKDRELMAIFGFDQAPGLKAGIGYSSPDTPERGRQGIGTFDVSYQRRFHMVQLAAGLKGLLGRDSISVATLSAEYPLQVFHLSVFGEVGEPLWGDNTRSTSTGLGQQVTLGTLGLHLKLATGTSLAFDLTNSVGETTGFSMTPALGNRYGLRLQLGQRF